MNRLVIACGLLACLVTSGGCGRTYHVRVGHPQPETTDRDRVALVVCKGRPEDRAQVKLLFPQAVAAHPGWSLTTPQRAGDDALLMELYVGQWRLQRPRYTLWREHWSADAGPSRLVQEKILARHATVEVLYAARGPEGRILVGPDIVTGRAFGIEGHESVGGDCRWVDPAATGRETVPVHVVVDAELINQAMLDAIVNCLDLSAGRSEAARLELDASDEDQIPWLELAEAGKLRRARSGLAGYLKRDPDNGVAAFNLGRLCEADGELERALYWYGTAISLRPEDRYLEAKEDCRRKYDLLTVEEQEVL